MTTIRVLYEAEPDFPPTDQHPDAVRYQVGEFWVDAVGGGQEVDRVLEDLGHLLYREKREQREKTAQQIIDRVKGFL
jgi:hypothetical protein